MMITGTLRPICWTELPVGEAREEQRQDGRGSMDWEELNATKTRQDRQARRHTLGFAML